MSLSMSESESGEIVAKKKVNYGMVICQNPVGTYCNRETW
jgi:hypothetical protein